MNKKILVAIHSGFIDTPAVERALAMASAADVDIMLYSAVYDEYIPNIYVDDAAIHKMQQTILNSEIAKLEKIKARLKQVAKSVTIETQWTDSTVEGIAQAAESFNADLLIVSSTRHSTVTRLFLSNTDWEILRNISMPILFAHNLSTKPYKKVVAAVEPVNRDDAPKELEKRMMVTGKWISATFNAELHLAHAYPSHLTGASMDYMISMDLNEKLKLTHQEALTNLASEHNIDKQNTHFLEDYPGIAIPKLVNDIDSDLVIMGIVSRDFIDRFMVGSTAEYLLDHLECDVLTIHANHKTET